MYRENAIASTLVFTRFNGVITAIDAATAVERWRYEPPWDLRTAMILLCGPRHLFLVTGSVEALELETGRVVWTLPAPIPKIVDVTVTDDFLFVSGSGQTSAIRTSDGSVSWTTRGELAGVAAAHTSALRHV